MSALALALLVSASAAAQNSRQPPNNPFLGSVPKGAVTPDPLALSVKEAVASGLETLITEHETAIASFGEDTRSDTLTRTAERIRMTRHKVEAYACYLAEEKSRLEKALAVASPIIDTTPDNRPRSMLGNSPSSVAPNSAALHIPALAQIDNTLPAFPSGFDPTKVEAAAAQITRVKGHFRLVARSEGDLYPHSAQFSLAVTLEPRS